MGRKNRNIEATGENTIIGLGTVINGDIKSEAAIIRIDGEVNGDVSTKGELIVGVNGIVNGNISVASLNLGGYIKGNVDAIEKIDIMAKGKLVGDISTKLLSMDETAIIQGQVNMTQETPAAEELKKEEEAKTE